MAQRQQTAPRRSGWRFSASGLGCALLLTVSAQAQSPAPVPNDDVAHRLPLRLNAVHQSRTDGCTVQRACVDERLTGKCVQYHNDQWFSFTPPATGRYYVNISQQQCRDVRGVQLVVGQGQPCPPAGYRVLSCTSLGNQDDVFVTLDDLQAQTEYLLNVDGYLHDYCRFGIEVSTTPRGMPLQPQGHALARLAGRTVRVGWSLPDTVAAESFTVWRREAHTFRSTPIRTVTAQRDAYGRRQPGYAIIDTLPVATAPARYEYHVVAQGGSAPVLVGQQTVTWPPAGLTTSSPEALAIWTDALRVDAGSSIRRPAYVTLPLVEYPVRANLSVLVLDAVSGRVLQSAQLVRAKHCEEQSKLALAGFQQQGVRRILVRIQHQQDRGSMTTREISYPL